MGFDSSSTEANGIPEEEGNASGLISEPSLAVVESIGDSRSEIDSVASVMTVRALQASQETNRVLIEELESINSELRSAKERAESAQMAKSEFLSRLSHELRTPLNSVLGFAQLLELQYRDPQILEATSAINRAGGHLLHLIHELLELSKVEAEEAPVPIEPVSVAEVVSYALDILGPIADAAGIRISLVESSVQDVVVRANRQRLLQVFINLLNNGVKYNHRGGSVVVTCVDGGCGWHRILVSDTGHGIEASDQDELFKPFQRFGNPNIEGTGLGLTLSRKFAQSMGGTLELANSSPAGSTFALDLPAATPALTGVGYLIHETVSSYPKPNATATILLMDDNLEDHRAVELALANLPGVNMIPVLQGSLGMELARAHRPSLILLDFGQPSIVGERLLNRVKRDPITKSIPVIVLCADATTAPIDHLVRLGASDHLVRPIDERRLIEAVGRCLVEPTKTESRSQSHSPSVAGVISIERPNEPR